MEEVCGGTRPYLSAGHLEAEHLRVKEKSLNQVSSLLVNLIKLQT